MVNQFFIMRRTPSRKHFCKNLLLNEVQNINSTEYCSGVKMFLSMSSRITVFFVCSHMKRLSGMGDGVWENLLERFIGREIANISRTKVSESE